LDSRRAAYHTSLGLAYLHQRNIVHGDLHVDNIAFRVPGLNSITAHEWMEKLNDPEAVITLPRHHQDTDGKSRPKYLVESANILDFVRPIVRAAGSENLCAVIIDFGSAFRISDPIPEICTPLVNRPPEALLKEISADSQDFELRLRGDIWSLGCTVYEIVVGCPLFNDAGREDALLRKMVERIGPPPQRWYQLIDSKLNAAGNGISQLAATDQHWVQKFKGNPELALLLHLMLQLDPTTRPSAHELMEHSWFNGLRDNEH